MRTRGLFLTSIAVAVALIGFAFVVEARLGDGALLPIHWNAAGEADGFAPALFALLVPPGLLIVTTAIFAAIPALEPLQDKLQGSADVLRVIWGGVIGLCIFMAAMIAAPAYGIALQGSIIGLAVGFLLVMVGNVLPKSRPGFFVGIRTPWTLTDTDNWIATHRLGGKLMMAAGAVLILLAVLPVSPEATTFVTLGIVLPALLVPIAYSWWFWRRKQQGQG